MSLAIDPEFQKLPEDQPLFLIWRIEKFIPVPWTDLGAFYTGDSYIVLSAVGRANTLQIVRNIYFWIGSESSPDEYTAAAIKSVELDDRFGGEPIQHRETQYHESRAFHRLFEPYGGVRYVSGGIDGALRKVESHSDVKLYQIKGRRNPILQEVPPFGTSLNHGDAFILTSKGHLFLWIGKGANWPEKNKASRALDNMRTKFKGVPFTRLDNSETTPEFWALLQGETQIASADEGGADDQHEATHVIKIYKVNGQQYTKFAEGAAAKRTLLTSKEVFIVERGEDIVVFLGKATPRELKRNAIDIGCNFLVAHQLPAYYSVSVAQEGIVSEALDLIFA